MLDLAVVVVVALLAAAAALAAQWSTSYLTRQIEHARQTCVTCSLAE